MPLTSGTPLCRFELLGTPLCRFELLTLDDDRSVLLIHLHHIISDGWSKGVLLRELQAAYNGAGRI